MVIYDTYYGSFCTKKYQYRRLNNLIKTINGHKVEKAFRRYIKADQM